ncbi:type IV pilus biogenesis protein PilP [Escherichia coli]|nr:type IV pilus biogenesis protein PilP [Escherichia coli]EHL6436891.1 type IV pilus biogenesis protein PilP [Escherichia coli]EIG1235956.1 type IV pilus biogenesis protein PilP [Escherichia coli]EIK8036356.1 type IV pilus biogenesis protein PilP [Escherichia coli]EJG7545745.1 type IV pilus biogenesis protein PilP [Escherichia coli]
MHAKTKALLVSALLLPATAIATTGNAEEQSPRQLQIERIQDETALYEAMLTREKIRHELRMLEQGIPAEPGRPQESTSAIPTAPSTAASPRLTEIFGVQPQLSARIELPGGHITDVKAGQNIPGTPYLVEKITPESVVLEQSGIRKTLRP